MSKRRPLGLLLAGGRSKRMQKDKAGLIHDPSGLTYAEYLYKEMQNVCDKVYVSVRENQKIKGFNTEDYPCIYDTAESKGPLSGILAAMSYKPDALWLVVACDLPNVDTSVLGKLIQSYGENELFLAYASSSDGLPEPLCALYHGSAADRLKSYLEEEIRCPRKILIREKSRILELDDPGALANMNTPDDLKSIANQN